MPRRTILGLTLVAALAVGCREPVAVRSVVLISLDTCRADHLGAYGYDRPTSPFLDTLAAEGVVFEQALANSSYTRESLTKRAACQHNSAHTRLVNDATTRRTPARRAPLRNRDSTSIAI